MITLTEIPELTEIVTTVRVFDSATNSRIPVEVRIKLDLAPYIELFATKAYAHWGQHTQNKAKAMFGGITIEILRKVK
jgi:hypothetical protein